MPLCRWCGEEVKLGEQHPNCSWPVHIECAIRSIVGGVNHQNGTCTCCGGVESPDPEGMTQREAAKAAARLYKETQGRHSVHERVAMDKVKDEALQLQEEILPIMERYHPAVVFKVSAVMMGASALQAPPELRHEVKKTLEMFLRSISEKWKKSGN